MFTRENILENIQTGDRVCLNRKTKGHLWWKKGEGSWFSAAQRLFTGKPVTHCASVMPKYLNEILVVSANESVTFDFLKGYLDEELTDIHIFRPIGVPKEVHEKVAQKLLAHVGKTYDFLQLLWFPYIALFEGIQRLCKDKFNINLSYNVKLWKNPFASDTLDICSELEYHAAEYMNEEMHWTDLTEQLNLFNENSCSAGDIYNFYKDLPNRFELIYESKKD